MLPEKISTVLTSNRADIADYEHALDIVENQSWGSMIVLKRSIIGEVENVKVLQIDSENKIKILNKEINTIVMSKKWMT